jgi:hypothetical protein
VADALVAPGAATSASAAKDAANDRYLTEPPFLSPVLVTPPGSSDSDQPCPNSLRDGMRA